MDAKKAGEGQESRRTMPIGKKHGQTTEERLADAYLNPSIQGGLTAFQFSRGIFQKMDTGQLIANLAEQNVALADGDLQSVESLLLVQAKTLNAIFNSLAQRSADNMGEYFEATDMYMKLALRAQSQCRATLDTLANMKKPSADLITHTNIAHGPQQINIHKPEEKQIPPNELLEKKEHEPDEWLDTGAPQEAVEVDKDLEAVGEIDRAEVV